MPSQPRPGEISPGETSPGAIGGVGGHPSGVRAEASMRRLWACEAYRGAQLVTEFFLPSGKAGASRGMTGSGRLLPAAFEAASVPLSARFAVPECRPQRPLTEPTPAD